MVLQVQELRKESQQRSHTLSQDIEKVLTSCSTREDAEPQVSPDR